MLFKLTPGTNEHFNTTPAEKAYFIWPMNATMC